jgi:rubrerythrin
MAYIDETKKEFICRQCLSYLDTEDLEDGKCPNCETDEDIFNNELNDD